MADERARDKRERLSLRSYVQPQAPILASFRLLRVEAQTAFGAAKTRVFLNSGQYSKTGISDCGSERLRHAENRGQGYAPAEHR